jgi:RNA polymerase sigma-70 factor (ECF subfamily)
LPDHHREVLVLVSASGFDYEEVSRILGCPLGTVKSRLSRARKSLEQILTTWTEQGQAGDDEPSEDHESGTSSEGVRPEEIH